MLFLSHKRNTPSDELNESKFYMFIELGLLPKVRFGTPKLGREYSGVLSYSIGNIKYKLGMQPEKSIIIFSQRELWTFLGAIFSVFLICFKNKI